MKYGCFVGESSLLAHSYQPSAGTRHRRVAAAFLNAGLSVSDSTRALSTRLPTDGSLAQEGTRPQRTARSSRWPPPVGAPSASRSFLCRTTYTSLVGATLKSAGSGFCPSARIASNSTTRSSGLRLAAYRPHMASPPGRREGNAVAPTLGAGTDSGRPGVAADGAGRGGRSTPHPERRGSPT